MAYQSWLQTLYQSLISVIRIASDWIACVQGCTVLAMDLMENGSLWMGLTRKGKDGKPLFQWNQRYPC